MASRAKLGVERETPMSNRLRSYKRKKHVSPVSTSGPSGHLAAHEDMVNVHVLKFSDKQNMLHTKNL